MTRASRVNGQQAVPFGGGHGYPVTLVDGHPVQGPADPERGVPVHHGAGQPTRNRPSLRPCRPFRTGLCAAILSTG